MSILKKLIGILIGRKIDEPKKEKNYKITPPKFPHVTLSEFTASEDNSVSTKDLLPGEIVLLDWIGKTNRIVNIPGYFEYSYQLNISKSVNRLLSLKLIEEKQDLPKMLNKLTLDELKKIATTKGLKVSGRKAEVINRIIPHVEEDEVANLPKIIVLTESGIEAIEENDYIIQAHSDKAITVDEAILWKSKLNEEATFIEIKWAYLNNEININMKNKNYGLLRNTYLMAYYQLRAENNSVSALVYIILVIFLDLSGLDNGYNRSRGPDYNNINILPAIFNMFTSSLSENNEDVFNQCFEEAILLYSRQPDQGFLKSSDFAFIQEALMMDDSIMLIERYMKNHYSKCSQSIFPESYVDSDLQFKLDNRDDEILDDCYELISTTKNPDTFFSRYEFFENNYPKTYNEKSEILYDEKEEFTKLFIINYFIDVAEKAKKLKTVSGRKNRHLKSIDSLKPYFDQMSTDNIDLIHSAYKKLNSIEE